MNNAARVEPTLTGFTSIYQRHVEGVRSGDLKAVMGDMDPAVLPQVFSGVVVPRGDVSAVDIRDIRVEEGRGVGECIYTTADGAIALRSGWRYNGSTWIADALSNFDA